MARAPFDNRLFGRHKARGLTKAQKHRLATRLAALRIHIPDHRPVDPRALFARDPAQVWLEIGFGAGDHLVARAGQHQNIGFIGCEPFVNGLAKAIAGIDAHGLENVRLYDDNALVLMNHLASSSVDRVFMLYPDPWPKRRHWKRRLINKQTLDLLARIMKPEAHLCVATDIDANGAWILHHCQMHAFFSWTATGPRDWLRPWAGWPGTRYETKARAAGRRPIYLTFVRKP